MTFRPSVLPTRDNTIIDTFTRTFNATQRAIAIDQANKRADRELDLRVEEGQRRNEQAILASNLAIAQSPGLSFEQGFGINQAGTTAQVTAETPGVAGGRQVIAEAEGPTLEVERPGVSVGQGPGGREIFFSLEAQRQGVEEQAIREADLQFRLGARQREEEASQLAASAETRFNALLTIGQSGDTNRLTDEELEQAAGSESATNALLAADRAAVQRLNVPTATTEKGLRAEFNSSPIFKDALSIAGSYASLLQVLSIPSSGPNDLSVIFSFMKMLDPGSVVREGEFANAANSQGWSDRARALYNRIARGERLSQPAREEFERSARALIRGRRSLLNGHIGQFTRFATDQEVDPRNVVTDPYAFAEGLVGQEGDENLDPGAGGADALGRIGEAGVGEGRWAGSGGVAIGERPAGRGGEAPPEEPAPAVTPAARPTAAPAGAPVGTGTVLLPTPDGGEVQGVVPAAGGPAVGVGAVQDGVDTGDGLDNAERVLQLEAEGWDEDQVIRIMRAEGRIA